MPVGVGGIDVGEGDTTCGVGVVNTVGAGVGVDVGNGVEVTVGVGNDTTVSTTVWIGVGTIVDGKTVAVSAVFVALPTMKTVGVIDVAVVGRTCTPGVGVRIGIRIAVGDGNSRVSTGVRTIVSILSTCSVEVGDAVIDAVAEDVSVASTSPSDLLQPTAETATANDSSNIPRTLGKRRFINN